MRDSFYTPTLLAEKLVSYISGKRFSSVADFCVGDGELLRAAQSLWQDIRCYGIDISKEVISQLSINHPNWIVEVCDFLNKSQRTECVISKDKKYDLILLNPPFTCKGSTINKVIFNEVEYKMSTAMMFLTESLQYLHNDGLMLAILPISCAYSQKDKKIWQYLTQEYNLRILEERDKQYFKKCYPNIVLVSINDKSLNSSEILDAFTLNIKCNKISTFRGNLSVNEKVNSTLAEKTPFIHSTNLINNTLQNITSYTICPKSQITGPAVLLLRVGNPNIKKICTISQNETYIISDCIIAIKTSNQNEANKLKQLLIKNWDYVKSLYKGTAAKYITLERLNSFLGI